MRKFIAVQRTLGKMPTLNTNDKPLNAEPRQLLFYLFYFFIYFKNVLTITTYFFLPFYDVLLICSFFLKYVFGIFKSILFNVALLNLFIES